MPKSLLDPTKMTLRQLQEMLELELDSEEDEHYNNLEQLLDKKTLIWGKGGSGKTTVGICIGHDIRERWNRPVIIVGTRMGVIREKFGEVREIDELEFLDQLTRINKAVGKDTDITNPEQTQALLMSHGVYLFGATILVDEGLNLVDRRRYSDPVNQVVVDFSTKSRHFFITFVVFVPREEDVDPRALDQFNWKGSCFYNEYTELVKLHLLHGATNLHLEWDTEDDLLHAKVHDMFSTHNVVGFRGTKLTRAIERLQKEKAS